MNLKNILFPVGVALWSVGALSGCSSGGGSGSEEPTPSPGPSGGEETYEISVTPTSYTFLAEITYNNLKELELTRIHVFPYSRRKGTIADKMDNQIETMEKKRRAKLIQEISDTKLNAFFNKNIETYNEVIIEKQRDKKTGLLKGITNNYINVLINNKDNYKDKLVKVRLTSISDYNEKMIAEIVT